jgi:head-tail adaptor
VSFVDGRMFDSLNRLFGLTCTIQASTESRDSSGQITDTWSNLAGHVNIPCVRGQAVIRSAAEQRGPQAAVVSTRKVIALAGYYPSITTKHRAVVASTNWNILDVRHDPSSAYTQLDVEVVSVA